tara:strand:+ start:5065 stop:5472 length:408 start_codon:yes stop_codon:yes gene_type:complete
MKPLLIFLISLLVFTFLGVELNWYSFIVLPILSLSLCFAIFQRNRLMPNLISVHQFICLFFLSIFVLHLLVYFLSPPYLRVIFETGIAVALFILITIIALRISTKEEKKVKAYKLLLQYAYLIFCFQMFPVIVSY